MLSYVIFFFRKPTNVSIANVHLFEHCIIRKIQKIIDNNHIYNSIIMNGETFLDGCYIEVISSNVVAIEKMHREIENIVFSKSDLSIIKEEENRIKVEVEDIDLTEEEKNLYRIFKKIDNRDIMELYNSDFFSSNDQILFFNSLISDSIWLKNDGFRLSKKNVFEEVSIERKNSEVIEEKILGFRSFSCCSVKDIVENLFFSFLFGRSDKSVIDKEYLEIFNLYFGYTVALSYDNQLLILLYLDSTQELQSLFYEENKINTKNPEFYANTQILEAYRTFLFYSDPLLREFSRLFLKSPTREQTLTLDALDSLLLEIDLSRIKILLSEGM